MERYGDLFDDDDTRKWLWWGESARLGNPSSFLMYFGLQVQKLNYGAGKFAAAVFAIGRAVKGHIHAESKEIFGEEKHVSSVDLAQQAIEFFDKQWQMYQKAVDTWSIVAIRLHVVRDIRLLIARIVWDSRVEAKY
jgi:hypothetical protein